MERQRTQYHAQTLGNALLAAAAIALALGIFAVWRIGLRVDDQFGFGEADLSFDDYVLVLTNYVVGVVTAVAILGAAGLYFRWLAVEQDARMSEFDALLGALGVPLDDDGDTAPEDALSDV
jgi:hypothetical protein